MTSPAREFWPLLALYVAPPTDPSGWVRRLTSIQLQKALFVLSQLRREQLPEFYDFIPYHFGPYSPEIERDLEELEAKALVKKIDSSEWEITLEGHHLAEKLSGEAPKEPLQYLGTLTDWMRRVPLSTLLRAIYDRFPDYARQGDRIPQHE